MSLERRVSLEGIHVAAPRGVRVLLLVDLVRALGQSVGALLVPSLAPRGDLPGSVEALGAVLGVPWGRGPSVDVPGWLPWALLAHGLLTGLALLGCLRLSPRSMSMRRRLGLLAVLECVALGVGGPGRAVAVTLWTGAIWVALLVGGLALSREVARVSGEEGLELDPSRPRL
jgi:hypothetical protein